MTQVIVLGNNPTKKDKPIEFKMMINSIIRLDSTKYKPDQFNYIELICKGYGILDGRSVDLLFAYNDPDIRNNGVLFLGHFNDGIV